MKTERTKDDFDEIRDEIEIHFNDDTGLLELSCGPDAFKPYLEIVRRQMADIPDISCDRIVEINVIDAANYPRVMKSNIFEQLIVTVVVLFVIFLVCVGFYTVIQWMKR